MSRETVLSVSGLRVERAGRLVVDELTFDLGLGEVLVILGPNGAGKTTLLESIAGLVPSISGSVRIGSIDIAYLPAHNRAQHGIRLVGQGRRVVPELTVTENLELAAAGASYAEAPAGVLDLFPRLRERRGLAAGHLSGGEQQMLALAMGLCAKPKVLILDEPSFGLAPVVVDALFETLRALAQEGFSIILAEQHVARALALAERVMVLRSGRLVYESAVTKRRKGRVLENVIEEYMGRAAEIPKPTADGDVEELVRLNLSVAQKRRLQLAARDRGISPSELVGTAVQDWLREEG